MRINVLLLFKSKRVWYIITHILGENVVDCYIGASYVVFPFVLTTADAINNAAGFGFRGYDRHGDARWDLISNLRIQQIEVSKSLTTCYRTVLDVL